MVVIKYIEAETSEPRTIDFFDQEDLDRWLVKKGIQSLRQGAADGPEVGSFGRLVETANTTPPGETVHYYPGPIVAGGTVASRKSPQVDTSFKRKNVPRWSEEELHQLNPVNFIFDTLSLHGREEVKDAIRGKVESLFSNAPINHGEYNVLVASGHVRSGKTRIGQEVFKSVKDILAATESPRYVPVNLGNGHGFDESFDPHVTPTEALGARIVKGYWGATNLKAIRTAKVIGMIAGKGDERRRPIVVHIDEHGQYASTCTKYLKQSSGGDRNENEVFIEPGRQKIVKMIDELVALATSQVADQKLTLAIVLSGTTFGDVSPEHDSMYKLFPLKLPVLNPQMCRSLALECIESRIAFFEANRLNIELPDKATIVNSPLFEVALADTGGLPGWVVELGILACSSNVWKPENYVSSIHDAVKRYLKEPNPERVATSVLVGFARPPLKMSSELLAGDAQTSGSKRKREAWTVQDASDSGSVNVVESTNEESKEIRIPAAVMASYNTYEDVSVPCDVSILCCPVSKMDAWTWQRFESAHIAYLAAVLHAIAETKEQFWTRKGHKVKLSNVLVGVSPSNHQILKKVFTPQNSFDALEITKDKEQCIRKANAKSKGHAVDTEDLDHMHQALDGTPIIDAYVNLELRDEGTPAAAAAASSAAAATVDKATTLFVQYKHSKLESDSKVKVSEMNETVKKLATYLSGPGKWGGRPWIFLWVTNRTIVNDTTPHPNLLWVGKDKLIDHAPLIGRRGLIPKEKERRD